MAFTQDWGQTRTHWPQLFQNLGLSRQPNLCFLEVGCYEGKATMWLLQNVLTHSTSRIHVVDTFDQSDEFELMGVKGDSYERFMENTFAYRHRIEVHVGRSEERLREMPPVEKFDFIYIDGSHRARDVLSDAVLCWPLLKKGSTMVFDDLRWVPPGKSLTSQDVPATAIKAFVACFSEQIGWRFETAEQLAIKKRRS